MKKILSLLLILITTVSIAQEAVILRLNVDKGQKYGMKMNMIQDMGIMKMDMKMDMTLDFKDIVNDIYNLEMGISRVQTKMKQSEMTIDYDSSKKEEDMSEMEKEMHSKMKGMLDFLIGLKIDKRGIVKETKFIVGDGDPNQIANNSTFTQYPEEAITVGTKWTQDVTNNGMKMIYNYSVKSIEENTVTLNLNGTVSELVTGTVKGTVIVDKTTGMSNQQDLVMDLETMGQKIKSTVIVTTTKL